MDDRCTIVAARDIKTEVPKSRGRYGHGVLAARVAALARSSLVTCSMCVALVFCVLFPSSCFRNEETVNAPESTGNPGQYNWSSMATGPYEDSVSFATGGDLLNWTDSQRVLAEHASVPAAVIKDGEIFVYFVDFSEDGRPEQLGMIRSTDSGDTWSKKKILKIKGIGDERAVDPDPFLLDDGRIRLYYLNLRNRPDQGNPEVENQVRSAISEDGENFVHEEGVRFRHASIYDPDVLKVGNEWRMYVGSVSVGTGVNSVITAVSSDGLDFKEEGVAFEGGSVPDAFFKDGTYYLYTAGINISESIEGRSFSRTGHSFHSRLGTTTADPSVVELRNGSYMMIFKFNHHRPARPPPGQNPPR